MIRRNCTPAKKRADFLQALRETYSVFHAAKKAGVGRKTVYLWRHAEPEFSEAWDDALASAVETLEKSLYERALDSDTTAAIFLLKGAKPEKYRERWDAPPVQNLTQNLQINIGSLRDDELADFYDKTARLLGPADAGGAPPGGPGRTGAA